MSQINVGKVVSTGTGVQLPKLYYGNETIYKYQCWAFDL